MPRQKNFKRLVRSRMAKTGESYTTARSHLLPPEAAGSPTAGDPDAGALARALAAAGVVNPITGQPFTEKLLFGLGGGIGFAYLVFDYPGWTSVHVDGRFNALYFEKTGFIETACARLGLPVRVQRLPSPEIAEKRLRQALEMAPAVALTVDLAQLPDHAPPIKGPYFPYPVTVSRDDPDLTVTGLPGGPITIGWSELVQARWTHAKKYGGLFLFDQPTDASDPRAAAIAAASRTADCLLAPKRTNYDSNFGVPGIRKWARLLSDPRDRRGWPTLFREPESLRDALASVVRGLGGADGSSAASRQPYATFLNQTATLTDEPALAEVANAYRKLDQRWAALVQLAGQPDTAAADLANHLPDLADAEEAAATSLGAATARAAERANPTTPAADGGTR